MLLGFTCISPYILMFGGKPWPAAVYLKKKNFHPFALGSLGLEKTYTVEPCPMATPLIWSHRYYSHIFLAWQNGHTFTYKKTLMWSPVNMANDYFFKFPTNIILYQNHGGGGAGGASAPSPHFFGNFKELLRKKVFSAPHFESLVSPPPHFQSSSVG